MRNMFSAESTEIETSDESEEANGRGGPDQASLPDADPATLRTTAGRQLGPIRVMRAATTDASRRNGEKR